MGFEGRHNKRVRLVVEVLLVTAAIAQTGCQGRIETDKAADRRVQPSMADDQNQRRIRETLLADLQPVTLQNCVPKRFGSRNDGGYIMCENLIPGVEAAYSYGIGGNDDWGCEMSSRFKVPVHQYDCFNPPNLRCDGGQFVPHNECVAAKTETVESRLFDTVINQIDRNGDRGKRMVVKIDVEGAEWDALLATPDDVLARIDQMPMELHGVNEPRFLEVVEKLKRNFHLVHLHFNNWACAENLQPFPSNAYQVLWVNKRVGVVGSPPPGTPSLRSLDAPDNATAPECQLPRSQE